ncbi:MAG: hypothetical protein FJ038_13135 [Chloroflexi bacterium]|nr:hypothetical protein [Chloroflexota bacterium]
MDLDGPSEDNSRAGRIAALIALIVVGVVAVVSYRITIRSLGARRHEEAARVLVGEVAANERRAATSAKSGPAVDGLGDDLTIIEGIGPRYDSVLKSAGITTYGHLADTRPGRLETILRESSGRAANPSMWPAQARLAADGRWQELRALQRELKAGRRAH